MSDLSTNKMPEDEIASKLKSHGLANNKTNRELLKLINDLIAKGEFKILTEVVQRRLMQHAEMGKIIKESRKMKIN